MPELEIRFSPEQGTLGSFRLMELPPDLCKLIESSEVGELKTYDIRSVILSNNVLVVCPPPDGDGSSDQVVIQDSLNEMLELVPTVPRLHRLNTLLKGHEWEEGQEEEDDNFSPAKRNRFTVDQARAELQASEQELAQALKEKHVLILDGKSRVLRPLLPSYLHKILELLLMHLVSLSQPHDAASVSVLSQSLEREHEVKREVTLQVVRQVGLGVLRQHKNDPVPEDEFMDKWNTAVGDTFVSSTSLQLLTGNYLCDSSPFSSSKMLSYFPCAELPVDPVARFTDLFLTRPRWKADDIEPYLSDIAVDKKELDKLLLRYGRAMTDKDGLWYTARVR
ncbi:hypothetical protein EI94DRAFT_1832278 [Lactarius quietus]|nr:hypothetical protein EI94DRAFT_1832278 [Lactarius quietus]